MGSWVGDQWGCQTGRGGRRIGPAPVFVGEHPLTVLALVCLPVAGRAEALRLEVLPQALIEWGPCRAARILLVAPQVQLALEELITLVAAERGVLCKTEGKAVCKRARRPPLGAQGTPETQPTPTTSPGLLPPWLLLPVSSQPSWLPKGCRGRRSEGPCWRRPSPRRGDPEPRQAPPCIPSSHCDSRRPCVRVEKEAKRFVYELGVKKEGRTPSHTINYCRQGQTN